MIDSDTAANDLLMDRLGGPKSVQDFLNHQDVQGIRIDRDERHLQTEIRGLKWNPVYREKSAFDAALAAVPEHTRDLLWQQYATDPRDTATPRGMAQLLKRLAEGKLLSPSATQWMMQTLRATRTFPDRLKAGLLPGWLLGHKTGSSGEWKGQHVATNDVGIITAPDGTNISIAVFVADASATDVERATIMARAARAVIDHTH